MENIRHDAMANGKNIFVYCLGICESFVLMKASFTLNGEQNKNEKCLYDIKI